MYQSVERLNVAGVDLSTTWLGATGLEVRHDLRDAAIPAAREAILAHLAHLEAEARAAEAEAALFAPGARTATSILEAVGRTQAFVGRVRTHLKKVLPTRAEGEAHERAAREALEAERQALEAERQAREAERQAERQAREAWIATHGSERLQALVREGIEYGPVFRDERLAADRPGWDELAMTCGALRPVFGVNVTAGHLVGLRQARAMAPDARLAWLGQGEHTSPCDCERGDDGERVVAERTVLTCEHVGVTLIKEVEVKV